MSIVTLLRYLRSMNHVFRHIQRQCLLCVMLCGGLIQQLSAQGTTQQSLNETTVTLDSMRNFDMFSSCSFLYDETGNLAFHEVLRASERGQFTNVGAKTLRVRGQEAVWVRFTVRNTKLLDWVLLVGNSRMDSVTLYTPNTASKLTLDTNDYLVSHSGEMTSMRIRAMQTKDANFPLVLADDGAYTFYVKIRAIYLGAVPIFRITPAEWFSEGSRLLDIAAFILLGMLLFAGLFNLVPLVIVRDKVYFWYIIHIASLFVLTLLACTVLTERFLETSWKPSLNAAVRLSTYAIFLQFARVFLDVKNRLPVLFDRLMVVVIVMIGLVFLLIPLGLGRYYINARPLVFGFGGVLALGIFSIELIKSRNLPTRIYTLTMLGYTLLEMFIQILGVQYENLVRSTFGVGETLLFSFALSGRLTQMREQVIHERQERELAEKMREQERYRNAELASANMEISRQNSILEEQSKEIELANAHLNEVVLELDAALTDLKETQSQLVASERVAAVGLLTSGVMHEINNPNAAVYAALEQLQITLLDIQTFFFSLLSDEDKQSAEADKFSTLTNDAKRMITIAKDGSTRVKHIVASLRNFTKHQEVGNKLGHLQEELFATIEMFRYQFKEVQVISDFQGNSSIEANFGEINQVVLNLLVNAAQAGATRLSAIMVREYQNRFWSECLTRFSQPKAQEIAVWDSASAREFWINTVRTSTSLLNLAQAQHLPYVFRRVITHETQSYLATSRSGAIPPTGTLSRNLETEIADCG